MHAKESEVSASLTGLSEPGPHSQRLERRFPVVTIGSECAIIVTSQSGIITDWNTGAEKLFGYRRHDAIGQLDSMLVPFDRVDEHQEIMEMVTQGKDAWRPETVRLHRRNGPVEVSLTASPLRDRNGVPIAVMTAMYDISEARRLNQQYALAQKMAAFGQVAAGVAHEFNNLLTIILGYSEILINDLPPDDRRRVQVGEIHRAGARAETLTRRLLSVTRHQVVQPRILNLNAVLKDIEKILRRLLVSDISLTMTLASDLWPVKMDQGQLQQLIFHLTVNARDAMFNGGRLTVETENVTRVELGSDSQSPARSRQYVMLAISDTGVGMSRETQARIAEPFLEAKQPGEEPGLGLATVSGIVQQYGGHIDIESELGKGTTIKVFLPVVEEPLRSEEPQRKESGPSQGKPVVLFVDDEEVIRLLGVRVLRNYCYTVLEARNGVEALRLVENHAGPIDLLVSDLIMPLMGGRELAERLLVRYPEVKVLFLSGYTSDTVEEHGGLSVPFEFLEKPFTPPKLLQKVRKMLVDPMLEDEDTVEPGF
jgi:PAS domain S-box-containing protein